VPSALVDTGAIVALINNADRHHAAAASWFRGFRGVLLTTEAVVTETAYVLSASVEHQCAALLWIQRLVDAGLLRIEPVTRYDRLADIVARYAGLPCDYADATLIALAEDSGVSAIATIDQRDFSTYRIKGRKRFNILLP
jgi:predicted nucleic acid-binding protein